MDRRGKKRPGSDGVFRSRSAIEPLRHPENVRTLQLIPVDKAAIVQLVIAAGLPLLLVVAKQVSLLVMLQWIVGKIL
jgi:hypothetical protein